MIGLIANDQEESIQIFGFMVGSLEVVGDIINPVDEKGDAESG
jgi:hypothetical protein